MSNSDLFQESILNLYLEKQDRELINKRWEKFQLFKSKIDGENGISNIKEEEYQEGFLRDVFVNCLGYTLKPSNNFNLVTEKKNTNDSKKADGAIILDNQTVGYIELKGQNSPYLDRAKAKGGLSPVDQAFRYLYSNDTEVGKYVIVSNFDELRFYIKDTTKYQKFSLFTMNKSKFEKLHTVLSFESIKKGVPLQIKKDSVSAENVITDTLYNDYTIFRTQLFKNIKFNNTEIDEVKLLALTQKLIDRIVFILFAEDTGILKPNTIYTIIDYHRNDVTDRTLYFYYKFYFEGINASNPKIGITTAFNGGLFAKDELLDSLIIDDAVLDEQAKKLSAYNFGSDISVNILGHIFEKSITALEEITAQIQDNTYDKKKSQQKIDGAFYTPEYITKYMIENTLGKLCEDKKSILGILEISSPTKQGKLSKKEKLILTNIYAYREWLLSLKIIDPACGSGAFLNQALEYLLAEHKYIDENRRKYENDTLGIFDIKSSILKNNLYGVDINEGAVEIAKLSLWLRTATDEEPLTRLAEKIKVGNSLIDDKGVVENAFEWEKEFPEVFKKGGFDVIVGNPPYIRVQGLKANFGKESKFYEKKYSSATGNYDIYALFLERSYKLLNPNGKLSFILPHKFLISDFGKGVRGFLVEHKAVENLLHFGSEMVFKGATTYTCIINLSQDNEELLFKHINPQDIFKDFEFDSIKYNKINDEKWHLTNQNTTKVLEKISQQPLRVKDVFSKIFVGLQTSGDNVYLLQKTKEGLYSKALDKVVVVEDGLLKPMLKGKDLSRYKTLTNEYEVIFPYILDNGTATPMSEDYMKENFPDGYIYLQENEEFLRGREKGKMDKEGWFLYIYPKSLSSFNQPKIITPEIVLKSQMSLDDGKYYHNTKCYSFIKKDSTKEDYKFYLAIFNSSLMWFFIKNTGYALRGGYFTYKTAYLEPFPLPKLTNLSEQDPFVDKVDLILDLHKQVQGEKSKFIVRYLDLDKVSKKLQDFEDLSFKEFITEYKKAKKLKFSTKIEEDKFLDEWDELFKKYSTNITNLKRQLKNIDNDIDNMVYKLYGLNEDEIQEVTNQT